MDELPFPAVVSRALDRLVLEAEAAAGASAPTHALWAVVVRCVADAGGGLVQRNLPEAARASRRLTTTAADAALRQGWVSAAGAGTHRCLTLTEAGVRADTAWRRALGELDARWTGTQLRSDLEALVGALPLELPHAPVPYGAADPSATGAPFVARKEAADEDDVDPPHGADWRPVRRRPESTTSDVPLLGLLSQVLVGFTAAYEQRFPWPLASTLTVLAHVGSKPVPLAELPPGHGITGSGTSLLERHLIVTVSGPPKQRAARLTDRGEAVLRHHHDRLATVTGRWRRRHGDDRIDRLQAELGALGGAGRSDHLLARLRLTPTQPRGS